MSFSNVIGPLFELGALAIVADTTKEILEPKKKKKAVVEHAEHIESFW